MKVSQYVLGLVLGWSVCGSVAADEALAMQLDEHLFLQMKHHFQALDVDHNGYISEDEARRDPQLFKYFVKVDKNGDGQLSAREFVRVYNI